MTATYTILASHIGLGSNLKSCQINTSQSLIIVECSYPVDFQAVGFQVIAQLGMQERVHRLYVNQTMSINTSASVEVEEDGEYQVSILPIMGERGITNSSVEYREIVTIGELPTTSGKYYYSYRS